MLTVKNLKVKYGSFEAIQDFNLNFQQNQIHGLIGPNGTGKTSLLNAIYGFIRYEGEIIYNELPICRKQLAFLETENFFYSNITGKEYLQLFAHYNPGYNYMPISEIFHLPLDKLIDDYSTGMKKKLAILATLILDKEILMLDEPFNGLDMESVYLLSEILKRSRTEKKTILITSHIVDSLTPICDEIHLILNKQTIRSYKSHEFGEMQSTLNSIFQDKYEEALKTLL